MFHFEKNMSKKVAGVPQVPRRRMGSPHCKRPPRRQKKLWPQRSEGVNF